MNNSLVQKSIPHLIATGIFLLVAMIFCLPVFQGMAINQSDMSQVAGMAQQSKVFYQNNGHYPLWTNSMFGGMPTYQIIMGAEHSITLYWLHKIFTFFLPQVPGLFFLACISFYMLCQVLKIKPWISILGALAYGFASYNVILMEVGHITKFAAMGYAPMLIGSILLLIDKKYLLGFLCTLVSGTLILLQNHVQVVYYILIVIFCLGISFLIMAIKEKDFIHILKVIGLSVIAITLGLLSFSPTLLTSQEYAKETMRGGRSELTLNQKTEDPNNKTKGGLDKDYAFQWSYGIGESFTFILPNYKGSHSGPTALGKDSKAVDNLVKSGLPEKLMNQLYGRVSSYWGDQPGTSGPVYFGAIICLLFVASLFFVDKKYLWWLLAATIIGMVLAWGSNLKSVNYFLFDHLPFYNKFRAPSMAMIIPQLTMIMLAVLALQKIVYGELEKSIVLKKLKFAALGVSLIIALLAINYFTAEFKSANDSTSSNMIAQTVAQTMAQSQQPTAEMTMQAKSISNSIFNSLPDDRKGIYMNDFLRMLLFLVLGGGLIWFTATKKIKPLLATILLASISFIDVVTVANRYLNKDNYVPYDEFAGDRSPSATDNQILADKSHFRVFNQLGGGNPFEDAQTSYFHNSVGGYSPVKLGLYQDLIEHQLGNGNVHVYDMLNTKYIIGQNPQTGQPIVQQNPNAAGNAWFVKNIKYVNGANEEMLALDSLDIKTTVVIDNREKNKVTLQPEYDSTAKISLLENKNDLINYQSSSSANQFAIFSEIYYPKGWKAYIDEKETPIVKVNYLLRGLSVPAGNHKIRFEFKPESYYTGAKLSLISGIISYLLLFGGIFLLWKKRGSIN
jgi:Bacterial membrane protein YfhO